MSMIAAGKALKEISPKSFFSAFEPSAPTLPALLEKMKMKSNAELIPRRFAEPARRLASSVLFLSHPVTRFL